MLILTQQCKNVKIYWSDKKNRKRLLMNKELIHQNDNRDYTLDILRISAAWMVLTVHIGFTVGILHAIFGANGVQLFFLLSGYLAFYTYDKRIKAGNYGAKKYYIGRIKRILPEYYAVIIIDAVFACMFHYDKTPLRYIFFLQAFVPSNNFELYSNKNFLWTMSTFVFFYALVPLLYRLINTYKKSMIVAITSLTLTPISVYVMGLLMERYTSYDSVIDFAYCFPINCLQFIFVGIAIYYMEKENWKYREHFIALLAIVLLVSSNEVGGANYVVTIIFITVMSIKIRIKSSGIRKIVKFFSDASFNLYLTHGIVLSVIYNLNFLPDINKFVRFVIYFAVAIVVSSLFTMIFSLIRRLFKSHS